MFVPADMPGDEFVRGIRSPRSRRARIDRWSASGVAPPRHWVPSELRWVAGEGVRQPFRGGAASRPAP